MRQQVRDHPAALAAWSKRPMRFRQVAVLALEGDKLVLAGQRLAVALVQLRFVIPCLQVRAGAGAEDDEDVPGLRREVWWSRRVGAFGGPGWAPLLAGLGEQALSGQQGRQRDRAQASAPVAEKIPPIEHPAAGVAESGVVHMQTMISVHINK